MNYRAAEWVRQVIRARPDVTPLDACIAHALAGFADRQGVAWPSTEELRSVTKVSLRQITRCLVVLESIGCITVDRRKGCGNRYRFPVAASVTGLSTTSATSGRGPDPQPQPKQANTSATEGEHLSQAVADGTCMNVKERAPIPDEFFAARQALRQRWRAG